jgi:hypothetical protein
MTGVNDGKSDRVRRCNRTYGTHGTDVLCLTGAIGSFSPDPAHNPERVSPQALADTPTRPHAPTGAPRSAVAASQTATASAPPDSQGS